MSALKNIVQRFTRSFKTTSAMKSGHNEPEGFPGANIPFSINNRYAVTALFTLFFGSGFAIPFIVVRYQLTR